MSKITTDPRAETPATRLKRRLATVFVGILLVASLSDCACRGPWVGPYGGVHPGRCFVG